MVGGLGGPNLGPSVSILQAQSPASPASSPLVAWCHNELKTRLRLSIHVRSLYGQINQFG